MTMTCKVPEGLAKWLDMVGSAGRENIYSAAGESLHLLVQRHLAKIAPSRHKWADMLGGRRTGHLEKGISGSSFDYDADHAEVTIPVPGISRAFGDVEITPKTASALTLPVHGSAYGVRVATLRALGWTIFRPKGHDVLMGSLGDDEPVTLYVLKKRVSQKQDRGLLPSDAEMGKTVAGAMMGEIMRIAREVA